jgi:deoxyribodipyrimidine photo-lyase
MLRAISKARIHIIHNPFLFRSVTTHIMSAVGKKRALPGESSEAAESKTTQSHGKSSSSSEFIPSLERRVRYLNKFEVKIGAQSGPVVYWMSRDQRLDDNWAVLYAQAQARKAGGSAGIHIIFNLADPLFPGANLRSLDFMLRGLKEVQAHAHRMNIPFTLLRGDAATTVSAYCATHRASLLVADFSPLRIGQIWRTGVGAALAPLKVPYHEVDAHNIVPAWVVSDKREYGARTIRTKCHNHMSEFLVDFPPVTAQPKREQVMMPPTIEPEELLSERACPKLDRSVAPVAWAIPGPSAGLDCLFAFLEHRLRNYDEDRNQPFKPQGVSGISPWLHFGSLSAQRCVLEARAGGSDRRAHSAAFVEEIFVRRELADNFCMYTSDYDKVSCAYPWAAESLRQHAGDKREYLYSFEEFDAGRTHDDMWNAAQLEMVARGKMHGYMRMYWCKKILEWTESPEQALEFAIALNDKWSLDGRDPNGYAGIAWSILGIHDQGWSERAVFGKIRFMNYGGLLRKFKKEGIDSYISYVQGEHEKYQKTRGCHSGSATGATSSSGTVGNKKSRAK